MQSFCKQENMHEASGGRVMPGLGGFWAYAASFWWLRERQRFFSDQLANFEC